MDKILKLIPQKEICIIAMEFIGSTDFFPHQYGYVQNLYLKLLEDWGKCLKKKRQGRTEFNHVSAKKQNCK